MHEVIKMKEANLLQGSEWKANCDTIKQEIISNDLEPKQIEAKIENGDTSNREKDNKSGSGTRCQTPVNEELWVVRKQLCRGCHSDGAFWSLQIMTEGVAYGDLLQTYFNIQLCPVSKDELALTAICALCAARLRDARAFYAQAHAAEERFTRFYNQNRVRVLANEELIKEDVTIVKTEDDDFEITDDPKPEAVDPNLNNEFETTDVGESGTVNSNLNGEVCTENSTLFTLLNTKKTRPQRSKRTPKRCNPELAITELAPMLIKNMKRQDVRCYKPASKKSIPKEVLIEEGGPKTVNEAIPKEVLIEEGTSKIVTGTDDIAKAEAGKPETSNPNIDDQDCDKTHVGGDKPASKILNVSPLDYEHVTGGFICARCGNMFNTLHSASYHVKHVHWQHSNNKSKEAFQLSPSDFKYIRDIYKCKRCDKQYHICSEMKQHIKRTHLKLPRFNCPRCGKTFDRLGPFTKHKFEEHSLDDRIKCNACDWFTYESNFKLSEHMKASHKLGEKITCPDCDYVCFTNLALRKHAVKHSTFKKHHCKYCKKSFLRKTNLTEHERIHTGDKRKVCNECGQAFVQRASLTYHMAKHHPEVRF